MKSDWLDISPNMSYDIPLDSVISFRPFIEYVRQRTLEDKSVKAGFSRQILAEFEQVASTTSEISLEKLPQFQTLFELMYAYLTPLTEGERSLAWGVTFPLNPRIICGTDDLYKHLTMDDGRINVDFFSKTADTYRSESLQHIYSLILKKLYNFHAPLRKEAYSSVIDPQAGIERYYQVDLNNQFVEVDVKGKLPQLDLKMLYIRLYEGSAYQFLEDILPLDLFKFSGISIITIKDVTYQFALENIKSSWMLHSPENERENYRNLIRYLKMLVNDSRIEFDLFPFFRVNGKMVYNYEKADFSLLTSVWGEGRLTPDRYHAEADGYSSNPNFFFSKNINEEEDCFNMLHLFKPYNVCSLALTPVFLNGKPLGVLGVYTRGKDVFDEKTLSLLEEAMPYLAQLLQVYIDEFNLEIGNIIKEKFTSIQDAVQWKFNEVAWKYLYYSKKKNAPVEIEPIVFENVSPLYGALDIRNSTLERNKAVKADFQNHLKLLTETLVETESHTQWPILDEMIFKCDKWLNIITSEKDIMANEETLLTNFLNFEIIPLLNHLKQAEPDTKKAIDAYLRACDEKTGIAFHHKREYEQSLQIITSNISHYIETEKKAIQESFPCYFEKFRTDGIEYDIYIGASIAPEKNYCPFHLKNLRLWQLKSMAAMAKITHTLLPQLPKRLQTTQLIFVHGKTIDISFRNDERRFDVERDYNIRYQMIKKRIDKVHIKGTKERLTQPGKIALVYLNQGDMEDYREHIHFLQDVKIIKKGLEEFELEDLQGISGLKALRVTVNVE